MSETTPNSATPPTPPASQPPGTPSNLPPTPPRKRKRRWLAVIGVLLVLVILLIALAPTIAGLGFVKSIVVGKANDNLNGSVEIGSYSVGWTGGINANDVKIYDAQKNLILQLNKFSSSLSLLDVIKGNFALGDTVVDVDLTRAEIDSNGQLNYAGLVKQGPKKEAGDEAKEAKEKSSKPVSLPQVSGKLTINYKGTIYQSGNALVQIQPSTATIDIPNINQPITDDIALNYSVNNGAVGTVRIAGTASAVKDNKLDASDLTADEKLILANVDLKAIAPFLQMVSPTIKLQTEGIASGSLALNAASADSLTAAGNINVAKFAASGAPLKGSDRLAIDQINIPVDIARTMKDGQPFIDVKHADVLLGTSNGGSELGKITIAARGPQDALISAAALVPAVMQRALLGTEPASQSLTVDGVGSATITANFDVAALASQLPTSIGLQKGTSLTQGHLTHLTTIAISKDTAKIDSDTKLPDLQGTNDGKPVTLSPIDIGAGLSAVGGTSPDLHDLSVHLSSGFLNATGGGATLSQEKLTGSFDLSNLQAQASQFVDLNALLGPTTKPAAPNSLPIIAQPVALAGAGTFELTTDGDLTKTDGQGKVATSLTITGIDASGISSLPPVKLSNVTATLSGDVHRSATAIGYNNFAAAFSAAGITVGKTDGGATPILDNQTITANVGGDIALPTGDGAQSIKLSTLQVKSSSDLFGVGSDNSKSTGALTITREKGIIKAQGIVTVAADLKKLNDLSQRFAAASASTPAGAPSSTNAGQLQSGQLQSGQLNGTLTLSRADQPRTDVLFDGAITNLTVTTAQKPITNETIKLTLHAVNPDDHTALKADASLDSRFMSAKLANAIFELNGSPGPWDMLQHADITLNIPDLPTLDEILNAFSAPSNATASAADFSPLAAQGAQLRDVLIPSRRPSADIIQVALHQTPSDTETSEEAARRRKREKAEKAAKAAKAARAAAETPTGPIPPLQITGGSAAGTITLHRDVASQTTTLDVSDFALTQLALARGDAKYAFARPIDLKLSIAVKAADDAGKPSLVAQVQQIQVTQLTGDLAIGKVTMPQPITITSPGDPNAISTHGSIKVDGALGDATPLLAVLQGAAKPMPYGGTYALAEDIGSGKATQGKLLKLNGGIDITNFQIFDDTGKAVYTEPTVALKDDLDYLIASVTPSPDPTTAPTETNPRSRDEAIVRSLTVNLPSSQALAINFSGRVADPLNKRIIKGLGTDPAAKLDVTYDLAKLWPIIEPTLAPDIQAKYKNLKVTGQEHEIFTVSGYFPMAKTMAESIHHLNAGGGFALEELDLPQGLTITKQDLPFTMTGGVVHTAVSAHPQTLGTDTTQPFVANTAICNQGAVDLSEIALDMGQPSPVLSIAKNHKLLQGVHVNPVLADSLGAANVLFKDATTANGLLDVTIVECDKVPLGDLIARRNDANATITYNVSDLSIDGPAPQLLSNVLPLGGQGLHGGIQNGKLTLANGEVNNDFSLNIIRYMQPTQSNSNGLPTITDNNTAAPADPNANTSATPNANGLVPVNLPLKFSGGVSLATGVLKSFLVNIPQGLLPDKWASAFPNGLSVPFSGNAGHPSLDIAKAVSENALGGGGNAGNLLQNLLKKKKKKQSTDDGSSQQQPQQQQ
jgi:hypothetical protein